MTTTNNKSYLKPTVVSVVLHLLLIVTLLWGTDFHMTEPKPAGQMVQAVVIDPALVQKQAQQIKRQREAAAKKEQDRLDKLRRESERLEKNRKAEEDRIRQLKLQQAKDAQAAREAEKDRVTQEKKRAEEVKQAKLEKKRLAKLETQRKAAAAKARRAKIAREKAAKEKAVAEKARQKKIAAEKARKTKLAKEKAAKTAADKARKQKELQAKLAAEKRAKAKLAAEKKEKEAALNKIFDGLESESAQSNSARAKYLASEVERYSSLYKSLIEQNLYVDDSLKGNVCRVALKLVPAGSTSALVSEIKVLGGDSNVCSAARRAIAQVPSFPLPKNEPKVVAQLRNINLTVQPE
ncbi:cell envelope integrity protein TolA [Vibrio profundum]|uniref:cell envelope integrity protein TolA n=1 Tax=Vibrio profundum TaxID=2910247 RepID=UPI003D0BD45C